MPAPSTTARLPQINESSVYLRSAYLVEPNWERAYQKSLKRTPDFMSILSQLGWLQSDGRFNRPTMIHLEGEEYTPIVQIGAVTAPGAGLPLTGVTILGPYDANGNSIVKANYQVAFPNGVNGFVTSVNTTTPFAHTVDIGIHSNNFPAMPAGTNMMFVAPSVGEAATSDPSVFIKDLTAYLHEFTAMRWSTKITDFSALADGGGRMITMNDSMPGPWSTSPTPSWTTHMMGDWWKVIKKEINYALLMSDRQRMTVRTAGGASFMDGIIPYVRNSGGNNFLTPASFSPTQFQNYGIAFLDGKVGTAERTIMAGIEWRNKFSDLVNTLTQQGNREQQMGQYVYDSKVFDIGGVKYTITGCDDFDSLESLGSMGFRNKALFLPPAEYRSVDMSDGSKRPLMQLKYKEVDLGLKGIPTGMLNFTDQRGPDFVTPGQQTTTTNAANIYVADATASLMTVFTRAEAFGICE